MAGDWLQMRLDLPDDPAVLEMAELNNVDADAVVGRLLRVWAWFSRHTTDGIAEGVSLFALGKALNLSGFPESMAQVGWLFELNKAGRVLIKVPRFDRHLSQSAKTRAVKAIQKRAKRENNASPVCLHSVSDLSPSKSDKTATREEERREELNKSTNVLSSNKESPPVDEPETTPTIVAEWNQVADASGLPKVKRMTAKRKQAIRSRLADSRWLADARQALAMVGKSDFLCGRSGSWRADFDWFVKPDSVIKILEGKYENAKPNARARGQPGSPVGALNQDVFELLVAEEEAAQRGRNETSGGASGTVRGIRAES